MFCKGAAEFLRHQIKRVSRTYRCILWLPKGRENVLVLSFIHILKTVNLQQLKGMQSCKLSTVEPKCQETGEFFFVTSRVRHIEHLHLKLFNEFSGKLPKCSLYRGIVNN